MLERETSIKESLAKKYPSLAEKIIIQRDRRLFIDADQNTFSGVFDFCRNEAGANILCMITGMDEGETFGILYHLATESGIMINIYNHVPRSNPVITSIIPSFKNADVYEREMVDLLGIRVEGLPEGKRYPLPDNWPEGQYPLRKEFDPVVLDHKGEK
jgi:membrane-bound hydrogenase subunit beta